MLRTVLGVFLMGASASAGILVDTSPGTPEAFASLCVPMDDGYVDSPEIVRSCEVTEFGEVGVVDGERFWYALYNRRVRLPEHAEPSALESEAPYRNNAVVLFRDAERGRIEPFWAALADPVVVASWLETPQFVESPRGPVLSIPHRYLGTGAHNEDVHLVWRDRAWVAIDTSSWYKELRDTLSEGMGVWKGIVIDMAALSASTALWRDGDGNCCPSGGTADLQFRLDGVRLRLDSVTRHSEPLRD